MANFRSLIAFLVLVVGGGVLIGVVTAPGAWYAELIKPSFNPPNWIFAPVWTTLYVLIAIAGWRTWRRNPGGWAMKSWGAQLVLNFIWSPVFFVAHQIGIALGVIALLFIALIVFIGTAWKEDRLAALLFLPYAAWVGFASILNGALLYLNTPTGY